MFVYMNLSIEAGPA